MVCRHKLVRGRGTPHQGSQMTITTSDSIKQLSATSNHGCKHTPGEERLLPAKAPYLTFLASMVLMYGSPSLAKLRLSTLKKSFRRRFLGSSYDVIKTPVYRRRALCTINAQLKFDRHTHIPADVTWLGNLTFTEQLDMMVKTYLLLMPHGRRVRSLAVSKPRAHQVM